MTVFFTEWNIFSEKHCLFIFLNFSEMSLVAGEALTGANIAFCRKITENLVLNFFFLFRTYYLITSFVPCFVMNGLF